MEPHAQPYSSGGSLPERLARVEERQQSDRVIAALNYESLQNQIDSLRQEIRTPPPARRPHPSPHQQLSMAAWVKLGLAALLPFLVYVLTGSVEQANHASKLLGGP
jgi:hypothetical protein